MSRGKTLPFLLAGIVGLFVLAMAGAFVTTSGAFNGSASHPSPAVTNIAEHATSTPTPSPSPTPVTPTPTPTPVAPGSLAQIRLWAGGDSLAAYLAEHLVTDARAAGIPFADETWKISSGLSRPDYYDWLTELQKIVVTDHPNVMVFMAGANDAQGLTDPAGHAVAVTPFDAAWIAEYTKRVDEAMNILSADGRLGIWVGMPIMGDPAFDAKMQQLDAIFKAEAARHRNIIFVDARDLFAQDGHFAVSLPGPNGTPEVMRAGDGVHLTSAGGEYLAQAVLRALRSAMPAPLPTPTVPTLLPPTP